MFDGSDRMDGERNRRRNARYAPNYSGGILREDIADPRNEALTGRDDVLSSNLRAFEGDCAALAKSAI